MSANFSALFYLISGILFILALRGLSSPETSRQGNYFGIAGMVISIIVTFLTVGNFGGLSLKSLGFKKSDWQSALLIKKRINKYLILIQISNIQSSNPTFSSIKS